MLFEADVEGDKPTRGTKGLISRIEAGRGSAVGGLPEGRAIPSWFGVLAKTARVVTRHAMSAIRESVARGVVQERDL